MTVIRGAGSGSKGGGGHTPTEADDSLQSVQYANVLDLLCEGPIEGLDNQNYPLNSIYLDGTPIQNSSGGDRFEPGSYSVAHNRRGTQDQPWISRTQGVSVEKGPDVLLPVVVTKTNPPATATQSIGDATNSKGIDKVRVTIQIPSLQVLTDKGDIVANKVKLKIHLTQNGGSEVEKLEDEIKGKSSSAYRKDYIIKLPVHNGNSGGSSNWPLSLRVERVSDDSTSSKNMCSIVWQSYTLISEEKLNYPNTALMYLRFDASSFSSIPQRKYLIRGLKVNIPHNGSVDTNTHIGRITYSGLFNGTVNNLQWTNDPAWCLWDLLTNTRYGAGLPASSLDAFDFYEISKYCNELVDDGKGGEEPRFSCNLLINSKAEVFKVIAALTGIFRGMAYYAAGTLVTLQEKPQDSQYVLGPSNVINGDFNYSGTSQKARHTVFSVAYQDYDGLGEPKIQYVEDAAAIAKYGIIPKDVQALGCYSQGQARRAGKFLLLSEQNLTDTVTFSVGIDSGIILRPGMVIDIADPVKTGRRRFGLISSATTTSITVDSETDLNTVDMSKSPTISVVLPTGLSETKPIQDIEAVYERQIDIEGSFSEAPDAGTAWLIQATDEQSQTFRVVAVSEAENGKYSVVALQYNSTIYDAVETDAKIEQRDISNINDPPGDATGLTGSQYLYEAGQVLVGFMLSWTAPTTGGPPSSYNVSYRFAGDGVTFDNWVTVNTASPSIDIKDLGAGVLQTKVQCVNYLGKISGGASESFTLEGKSARPGDVQNLTFESINTNSGRLRWDQSVDLDVKVGGKIFIRHSSLTDGSGTWSNSTDLIDAKAGNATEAVVPKVSGEILVKFEDSTGNQSLNEASVIITLAEKNQTLIVKNQREDQITPTPFSGSKTNTVYDASVDALELTVSGGNVSATGSYTFASVLDLEHTYALDLSRYFVTRGNFENDLIDNWPDVNSREDWDGGIIDSVNAALKIRTTTDDPSSSPTWGSWMPCANGTFSGRGFQFKTDLTSTSTDQNILVDQLGYLASLDQRTEQSNALVASGTSGSGKSLTFDNAFFTGTSSLLGANTRLPSIGIVAQNMASGDYYNVTAVSSTGFTVIFKNSSNAVVDRSFYWTAVGYGKRA
jgi:predicted phage tail protein